MPRPAAADSTPGVREYTGRLSVTVVDDFARDRARYEYTLSTAKRRYRLRVRGALPPVRAGQRVRLTASTPRRGVLRVQPRAGRAFRALRGGVRPAAVPDGARTTAVVLFNFQNDTDEPWTAQEARDFVFDDPDSVSAFLEEGSGGRVSLAGDATDVYGWYTVPFDDSGCESGYQGWAQAAARQAQADGFSANIYNHVIYAFPAAQDCDSWAGRGDMPGKTVWINGFLQEKGIVAHEIGHNLGFSHANGLRCFDGSSAVPILPTCRSVEYQDPFDTMGSAGGFRHFANYRLGHAGWLQPANITTAVADGEYTITKPHPLGTGTQLLRIPRDGAHYYDLEIRAPFGTHWDDFDTTDPVVHGVSLRLDNSSLNAFDGTELIDMDPETPDTWTDAPLLPGETFSDPGDGRPGNGLTITVESAGSGVATVNVDFAAPPDLSAPTRPEGLAATPNAAGTAIDMAWQPATDDVGVTGYEVYRSGAAGPIATVSTPSYSDASVARRSWYSYEVVAVDGFGNRSPVAEVTQNSAPLPTAPTLLTARRVADGRAGLSWRSGTSEVGPVWHGIVRDGVLQPLGTFDSSAEDDAGLGVHAYSILPVDEYGREGARSNELTVNLSPDDVVPEVLCLVPRLKGKRLGAARRVLEAANCRLGGVRRVKRRKGPYGRVTSQRRRAGSELAEGTRVGVTIRRRR
jgi:hypothetical protein